MMKIDPYNYLNERNAIMLNVKNPVQFNNVYEEALQKHFKKQMEIVDIGPALDGGESNPLIDALIEELKP